ncbi:MAG: hypothetical protein GQ569_10880 [Methylococcaceae bacterium]|nr:hypothetical protein [Methylococcaceae bacterium]
MASTLFSPKEQKILDLRTQKIAKPLHKKNKQDSAYLQICFDNNENYGIPVIDIEEVLKTQRMANVPCTPDFIAGVINRRSEMIAVLDLNAFFGLGKISDNKDSRIIVVNAANLQVGILTSMIIGEVRYHSADLAPPFQVNDGVKPEYISGIHNNNVQVINLEHILLALTLVLDSTI